MTSHDLVGQHHFEDDFYLGSAEKLYSTMRHLHYETEGTNLYKLSNPMVIANFDLAVSTSSLTLLCRTSKTTTSQDSEAKT